MYAALRPLLFALDAETAHGVTLRALRAAQRLGLARLLAGPVPELPVEAFGLRFPNPVGLAAGLDKDGTSIAALGALGFGFIEIGTTTPRPQGGNPRPRLFRLTEHEAVINRMGFNNAGVDALVRNVERSRYKGILGINIGRNKDTPNERAADDYLHCLRVVWPVASYVTVNISSPNTQGLRELQRGEALRRFLWALLAERERLTAGGRRKPLLLKIAPDLDAAGMDAIAAAVTELPPDGLICTNTTVAREAVAGHPLAGEAGGLSGRPLRPAADAVLRGMHERLGERMPLIGVGGILEGDDAAEKLRAGARLVQLYSGLVYRGPELVGACVRELQRQFRPPA